MIKERDSGIELLRIIASLMVIVIHFNLAGAIDSCNGLNKIFLFGLESLGICAVNLFLLITGYFSAYTKKCSLFKITDLLGQLLFVRIGIYVARVIINHKPFLNGDLIKCFIPNDYYLIFYIVVVCLAPYINIIFEKLRGKQLDRFILIAIGLFSIYPYAVDLLNFILENNSMGVISGISTITRGGGT